MFLMVALDLTPLSLKDFKGSQSLFNLVFYDSAMLASSHPVLIIF